MRHLSVVLLVAGSLAVDGVHQNSLAAGAAPATTQPASAIYKLVGRNECASCEGITASDDDVLLIDKAGGCWLLIGSGPSFKAAQEGRNEGKIITATVIGKPVSKIGMNGKPYKEVNVSDIKIDA